MHGGHIDYCQRIVFDAQSCFGNRPLKCLRYISVKRRIIVMQSGKYVDKIIMGLINLG